MSICSVMIMQKLSLASVPDCIFTIFQSICAGVGDVPGELTGKECEWQPPQSLCSVLGVHDSTVVHSAEISHTETKCKRTLYLATRALLFR